MRRRKVRGHRRIWRSIDKWVAANSDINSQLNKENQRFYASVAISPYNSLSMVFSSPQAPRRETKRRLLNGLMKIYESWQASMEATGNPYYLKIWLYEPRFIKSQIVLATGSYKDFYADIFPNMTNEQPDFQLYGNLSDSLKHYRWSQHADEDSFLSQDLGNPDEYDSFEEFQEMENWYKRIFESAHRVEKVKLEGGGETEIYFVKKGFLWIGEK